MLLALCFRANTGARDVPRGQAGSQHTQARHRLLGWPLLLPVLATYVNQSPKALQSLGLWRALPGQRLVSAGLLEGTHKTSPKAWTVAAEGTWLIVTQKRKMCLARPKTANLVLPLQSDSIAHMLKNKFWKMGLSFPCT